MNADAPTKKRMCECGKSAVQNMKMCWACWQDAVRHVGRLKEVPDNAPVTTRLSGQTGICPHCKKRGCMICK